MSYTPTRSTPSGTIRIFSFRGIDVFLHWSWAVVALIELRNRNLVYESQIWNVAEYLSLFVIVLLHEFGHAFACRSVGGSADTIMLWPLGGIAFVRPPFRAGANLWSIAAGPLVNVALAVPTIGAVFALRWYVPQASEDLHEFAFAVAFVNVALLIFNLLPIYPLDGGQILQSFLWFFMAYESALRIAATVGMIASAVALGFALYSQDIFLIAICVFAAFRCWHGLGQARAIREQKQMIMNAPPRGL